MWVPSKSIQQSSLQRLNSADPKIREGSSPGPNSSSAGGGSDIRERELQHLEKMKRRQQQEIHQILESEMRTAEIRARNEEKMRAQKEKEAVRQQLLAEKAQRQEELRKAKEEEKQKKLEEEAAREAQRKAELEEKERLRLEETARREAEHRRELLLKEAEQKAKQEAFRKEAEKAQREQEAAAEQRKREREEKDRRREEAAERRKEESRRLAELKRREVEKKLEETKRSVEVTLESQRAVYSDCEMIDRGSLRRKSRQQRCGTRWRRNGRRGNRLALEREKAKEAELARIQDENRALEEQKKAAYLEKLQRTEETLREKEEEERRRLKERQQAELAKDSHRKSLMSKLEDEEGRRRETILQGIAEQGRKVAEKQRSARESLVVKAELGSLRLEDRKEAWFHVAQMQNYASERIMERLEDRYERIRQFEQEKLAVVRMREQVKKQISREKERILSQFERSKRSRFSGLSPAASVATTSVPPLKRLSADTMLPLGSARETRSQKTPGALSSAALFGRNKRMSQPQALTQRTPRTLVGRSPPPSVPTTTRGRRHIFLTSSRGQSGTDAVVKRAESLAKRLNDRLRLVIEAEEQREGERDRAVAAAVRSRSVNFH